MNYRGRSLSYVCFFLFLCVVGMADDRASIVSSEVVFLEKDGMLAVEAEHFAKQSSTGKRAFYLTSSVKQPKITPDGDPAHVGGASGGAYLEVLPDTRRTHADKLIGGENFSNVPGKLAILTYRVHITNPGRYYVWVRAHSTGSEDNGLHVGLDGEWPESGQRLQWCSGKHQWFWESKQRTQKQHCGEPYKIYLDIDKAGEHSIHFSMREDGFEFDKWLMTKDRNLGRFAGVGPASLLSSGSLPKPFPFVKAPPVPAKVEKPEPASDSPKGSPTRSVSSLPLILPRGDNGDASVSITGELRAWNKVTLTLDGPYAHEKDNKPNPFIDYDMSVRFRHSSGKPNYVVPAYFAADGNAGESSAESGTKWRAHLSPDKAGSWTYEVSFRKGSIDAKSDSKAPVKPYHGVRGTFEVAKSSGKDARSRGRLTYVGKRYLRYAGSGEYFLKAGADAPETFLGYADFDNTIARKKNVPLKTYAAHSKDWSAGDPTWRGGKGKGMIGAVNYLASKGCNVFSFLTYNAGGDGDNVWPFIQREDKLHYDCSKLDQWSMVFDHATTKGMYLHFKLQETEIDDHRSKGKKSVPECLDGGALGVQRRLYCREIIARFGHNLALNWNLGEENTQTNAEQNAMANYIAELDPYDHLIVVHTYPGQQDQIYRPLLGGKSALRGFSVQNSHIRDTHWQTVKWVRESTKAGVPWVVGFDESGSAAHGQCPDLGYRGFDGKDKDGKFIYTEHEVRRQTLWGALMGGGAGVEYYFGYKFAENDLVCEDWRSRDKSWDYCRIALDFFRDSKVPFWDMQPADELVGNSGKSNDRYCLAKSGEVYLVYVAKGAKTELDLSGVSGEFTLGWFNPRTGGRLVAGSVKSLRGGSKVSIGKAGSGEDDWLAVIRKR